MERQGLTHELTHKQRHELILDREKGRCSSCGATFKEILKEYNLSQIPMSFHVTTEDDPIPAWENEWDDAIKILEEYQQGGKTCRKIS